METIKKPDLNAPRFRPTVYNFFNKDLTKKFKTKYSKFNHIEDDVLKKLVKTCNEQIYHTVIDKRDGVALPDLVGWLFIGTCEQAKKQNIDFAKSHKYGAKVTNRNWDSDGKLAKIFYSNYASKIKMTNREYWGFTACRNFKRLVAKTYPENWPMYLVVEPTVRINKAYTASTYKDMLKRKTEEGLQTYNEFNI